MTTGDPRELRNAFGTFATGVTVVTTVDAEGSPRGFTANSFSSVSLDPPLVSVCIANRAGSFPAFSACRNFAVNILSDAQEEVSNAFASPTGRRFEAVSWHSGTTGSPLLAGTVAWFDCETHDTVQAGDHLILIGRVADYAQTAANPLGYCRGAYVRFGLASQAVSAAESGRVRIGAIIEHEGRLYLPQSEDGAPLPPTAARMGPASAPDSLLGELARRGIVTELPFVFAVFEDAGSGTQNIYYRGQATTVSEDAAGDLIALDALDTALIRDAAVRSMMERYVRERTQDTFGVYVGDSDTGAVSPLASA